MSKAYTIVGRDALRIAERDLVSLYCEPNPLGSGEISAFEGRAIAKNDPALLYIRVTHNGWHNGRQRMSEMEGYVVDCYFTSGGMYLGPDDDCVEPTWRDAL
jgi:hypothetical protein